MILLFTSRIRLRALEVFVLERQDGDEGCPVWSGRLSRNTPLHRLPPTIRDGIWSTPGDHGKEHTPLPLWTLD